MLQVRTRCFGFCPERADVGLCQGNCGTNCHSMAQVVFCPLLSTPHMSTTMASYTLSAKYMSTAIYSKQAESIGIAFSMSAPVSAPQRLSVEDLRRSSHRQIRYTASSAAAMIVKRTA